MNPPVRILRGAIRAYQLVIARFLGGHCRFAPSCSEYAMEAVTVHGAMRGTVLAAKRIARCHPWGRSGYDPVPAAGDETRGRRVRRRRQADAL